MPLPPRHSLSKTRDEETDAQTAIFQCSTYVGMLARQLFPDGVDASPPTFYQYQQSVAHTARLIQKGVTVIYEAAFQFDGLMAAIDILVQKNGKWYDFEVKGTAGVKPPHIQDAAMHYYVITPIGSAAGWYQHCSPE